jgi:hypothetical protein
MVTTLRHGIRSTTATAANLPIDALANPGCGLKKVLYVTAVDI